jgi:transcriptional regulator with XRE-family HTH domain
MAHPGRKRREDSPYGEQAQRLAAGLRSRREGAGMTQEQLAAQARVAVATVRKIESGSVTNPGVFTVVAMLSALGAAAEDIAVLAAAPRLELPCVTTARDSNPIPWDASWDRKPAHLSKTRDLRPHIRDICPASDPATTQQATFNPLVQGSTPWRPTSPFTWPAQRPPGGSTAIPRPARRPPTARAWPAATGD